MRIEQGSRSNVIAFPKGPEYPTSGSLALKKELWSSPQVRDVAPVVQIDQYRVRTAEKNSEKEKLLVYDPSFDERDYKNYHSLSEEEQERLRSYTKRQFETYLGERVNVILSVTNCDIIDGKIVPEGVDEPMENIIRRGIEWRRIHGNPLDFKREDAELTGFLKTQERLTDPKAPIGAMNLSVSPQGEEGSDYTNNFFDEAVIIADQSGKRKIQLRRYLSRLTVGEYEEKLKPFKSFESTPSASDFLENPIEIDNVFETPDDLQKYLSGGVDALEIEKLDQIKQIVAPYIASYIRSLIYQPDDLFLHRLNYNAVLNQTDIALGAVRRNDQRLVRNLYHASTFSPQVYIEQQMRVLGMKPVREAGGPCPGKSGGFDLISPFGSVNSPFSVSEFGQKNTLKSGDKQILCCTCPFCEKQVEAEISGGKIHCPNCDKSAPWSN